MVLNQVLSYVKASMTLIALYRPSSIESTPLTVMYGATVWCSLRSGQLERNRSQRLPIKKF